MDMWTKTERVLQSLYHVSAWRSIVCCRITKALSMLVYPRDGSTNGDGTIEVAAGIRWPPIGREQKMGWTRLKKMGEQKRTSGTL